MLLWHNFIQILVGMFNLYTRQMFFIIFIRSHLHFMASHGFDDHINKIKVLKHTFIMIQIVFKLPILAQQDLLICICNKRVASGLNLSSWSRFQGYICKGSVENDPKHLQIVTKLNTTLYIIYCVMANGGFNLSQQVEMLILHNKNYNYVKRRKRRPRPSYVARKFTCRD